MGHIHLGVLPRSAKWREVLRLLELQAEDDDVIAASAVAAENEFARAASDQAFVEAIRLLALIPQAAKGANFTSGLRDIGIKVSNSPLLMDLIVATGAAFDAYAIKNNARSDFGELSRRALLDSLCRQIGAGLPGLFAPDARDVQLATAKLADSRDFATMARAFFTRLTRDTLSNWLDRTLSTHVGPNRRFAHAGQRSDFDGALDQYCSEATRIIREFSGGWYGATIFREKTITRERAAGFGYVAFKKIGEELRQKRDA